MFLLLWSCIGPDLLPAEQDSGPPWGEEGGPAEEGEGGAGEGGAGACGAAEVELVASLEGTLDECADRCITAALRCGDQPLAGVSLRLEVEGARPAEELTDAEGAAELCLEVLPVGAGRTAVFSAWVEGESWQEERRLDVAAFGHAWGLDKSGSGEGSPWEAPARSAFNPVLEAGEGWDAAGVLMPSVIHFGDGWLMYYAGTSEADYELGLARSDDGLAWRRIGSAPLIPAELESPGSWKRYATNSPFALADGDRVLLWYTGRASEEGTLAIGLAESTDGQTFEDFAGNPVFEAVAENEDWEGDGVAHPAVILRDGVFEMWYSTGAHHIGHALSTDGKVWERYCGGPVFDGEEEPWEQGQVKSAEVVYADGLYRMAYTGGQAGDLQIGQAWSADGIRWTRDGEVWMPPGEAGGWESQSTVGPALALEGDTLRVWYSGTSATTSAIGAAELPWD